MSHYHILVNEDASAKYWNPEPYAEVGWGSRFTLAERTLIEVRYQYGESVTVEAYVVGTVEGPASETLMFSATVPDESYVQDVSTSGGNIYVLLENSILIFYGDQDFGTNPTVIPYPSSRRPTFAFDNQGTGTLLSTATARGVVEESLGDDLLKSVTDIETGVDLAYGTASEDQVASPVWHGLALTHFGSSEESGVTIYDSSDYIFWDGLTEDYSDWQSENIPSGAVQSIAWLQGEDGKWTGTAALARVNTSTGSDKVWHLVAHLYAQAQVQTGISYKPLATRTRFVRP